jgi:hypothetical protein
MFPFKKNPAGGSWNLPTPFFSGLGESFPVFLLSSSADRFDIRRK